jgi:hypothetical protein
MNALRYNNKQFSQYLTGCHRGTKGQSTLEIFAVILVAISSSDGCERVDEL